MSEGIGWAGRLRRVVNARMEEMSFRSGLAVLAAVLALTGAGVGLAIVLGGSGGQRAAAAPRLAFTSSAAPVSAAPLPSASADPSPSASPSAMQDAPESAPAQAAPQPGTATSHARSPRASPAASTPWPTPRPIPSFHPASSPGTGGTPTDPPQGWWPPAWEPGTPGWP